MRKKIWVVVFCLLAVIVFTQLVASNFLAGKGEELTSFERKATKLSRENQNLQEELAHKSSLSRLSVKAQAEGFTKPDNILYLDTSLPVAILPQ